jgi:hypothetical protein
MKLAVLFSILALPATAATVLIPETGLLLRSLLPADTQGEFGMLTQARNGAGTYTNMSPNYSGLGDYYWFSPGGSPRIYPAGASANTTSGTRATPNALYAPPGNGIDSIIRVDATLPSGANGIRLTGSVLHFQVSGTSNVSDGVTAFIYTDVTGYGSPVWSHTFASNNGSPSISFDVSVPFAGATNLYLAISDNGNFIADHTDWVNVNLTAIPEPATVAFFAGLGCLAIVGTKRYRRAQERVL